MISVIIPCYNCVPFIKRAINSVLNQGFQDYELILIDNRSTDGTVHILNYYKETYPEKVRLYHEYKRGAPAARNKGMSVSNGEWLQFLDADDELQPEKLARQAKLAKNSDAGIIIGDYIIERGFGRQQENKHSVKDPWTGLINSCLGVTSSNLWKKSDLESVGGWNEDITSSQEYDLLFRLLKNGSQLEFDTTLSTVVHREGNSISRSDNKRKLTKIVQNRIDLRYKIKAYLNDTNQLTKQLSISIDTYIYSELKSKSGKIPEYANAFIRDNMLEVPFNLRLKTNARLKIKQWLSYLR